MSLTETVAPLPASQSLPALPQLPSLSPWKSDKRMPGLRLHLDTGVWYLNKRVGRHVLSERTPFTENQRTGAKEYLMRRVIEERKRQELVQLDVLPMVDRPVKPAKRKPEMGTWGDVINAWLFRLDNNPSLSDLTRANQRIYANGIRLSWKTVHNASLDVLPLSDRGLHDKIIRWHGWFGQNRCSEYCNKVKAIWANWFAIAIEKEAFKGDNIAAKLPWIPMRPKTLVLPSKENLRDLLECMRSHNYTAAADLLEGMTYTGLRRSEAAQLKVYHVVLTQDASRIELPAEIVKGRRRARSIPLQSAAVPLFTKLVENAKAQGRSDVFPVKSCRVPLKQACKRLGMMHLTHHKFRHLFATFVYEQTGNASLVAKWLGHGDGGVLVHKTYNHVRFEYEAQEVKKLDFGIA